MFVLQIPENLNVTEKLVHYNRWNRDVAILCNHQRAKPKTFDQSMENIQKRCDETKEKLAKAKASAKECKEAAAKAKKAGKEAEAKDQEKQRTKCVGCMWVGCDFLCLFVQI